MKYYIVAEVRSRRQADHVRRNIPQLDFDIITIKEDVDTDGDTILKKEQSKCFEVDGGHLGFDYVNFNAQS